jgi:hypothetical protein
MRRLLLGVLLGVDPALARRQLLAATLDDGGEGRHRLDADLGLNGVEGHLA